MPNIPALPYDLPEQYPERQQQKHQRKNKQKGRHKGHNSIHPTTSEDNLNYLNSQYNPDTTQTDDNPFGIQPTIPPGAPGQGPTPSAPAPQLQPGQTIASTLR
ncbi:MAG: hypothetical protein WAK17_01135 [Candidatus Nitrosopolaris sp.]